MSVAVRVRGLRKSFRDATRTVEVLRGVDFELAAGEVVAVVGPSGSGKSTLLHLLGGLERADAGEIEIGGQRIDRLDATALAAMRNRTIGYVFQFHQLLADFTALENVALPGRIAGRAAGELRQRAEALLAEVGLRELAERFPGQLSGGEQQRVAICRALLLEPPLVLADEPTGSLDPLSGSVVFDLLLDLQRRHGTTALVVTHNPELARRCARILTLESGVIRSGNL
jgi:ABC-type lipoprotein export system ATPase subunit